MFTTSIMFITNISYLFEMTKKNKLSSQKRLAIAGFFAIFIALLFMISSVPAQAGTVNHQLATEQTSTINYIPNPLLNSNITWNTYNSTWGELEYQGQTGKANITAQPSQIYKNPISVQVNDLKPKTLNGKYAGTNFFDPANYNNYYPVNNHKIGNTSNELYLTGNASSTQSLFDNSLIMIPWAQLPSQNYNYVYITATISLSAGSGASTTASLSVANTTEKGAYNLHETSKSISSGQSMFISISLAQLLEGSKININSTRSPEVMIGTFLSQPSAPKADTPIANLTITNFAITTYPMTLGTNSTGQPVYTAINEAHLTSFKPTVSMTIENNGYTVAVSKSIQNETISQTSINNGVYTEEATYQGILTLPSAPDLSYSNSIISMKINLTGKQYLVANLNGISYLSSIQKLNNGTFTFTTVNANSENSIVIEAEYTTAQWNASTSAPSFFSVQGLEYYWWVGLIGLMSVIGLGAAASSHFSGEEENLRIPKGKFGR